MSKQLRNWELAGVVFTAAAGTLLHFVFAWSGGSSLTAVVAAVNESTWEHMKLLFMPAFVFTLVQFFAMGRSYPNYAAVRGVSVLAGTVLIPVLFYTYTGSLGYNIIWVDIAIFFVADFFLFRLDYTLLRRGSLSSPGWQVIGVILLWGMLFLFIWYTFSPLHLNLWKDPLTGGYGIS